jgi:uncharacterized protein (TIGR02598 family)
MNPSIILKFAAGHATIRRHQVMEIGSATGRYQKACQVKSPMRGTAGFSLVEVTISLGVAALCLILLMGLLSTGLKTQQAGAQQTIASEITSEILGDLRADIRLPPGQASHEGDSGFGLHGHWAQLYAPDTLYFNQQGKWLQLNGSPPADATFRAKITYLFPPNTSTSVANILVSWPAKADPATVTPVGSVQTFIAVNR